MKKRSGALRGRRPPPVPSPAARERGPDALRTAPVRGRTSIAEAAPTAPPLPRSGGGPGRGAAESQEIPQSTIALDITVERASPLWDALAEAEQFAARAIFAAAASCGVKLRDGAEVGVQLVDDESIQALNARWRGFDKPTNVLSFPASPVEKLASAPLLGDIVVAYETTRREADDEGIALGDHFVHLVVHGFLHLVGFDHERDAEAETMETLETRVLEGMAIADPYRRSVAAERA